MPPSQVYVCTKLFQGKGVDIAVEFPGMFVCFVCPFIRPMRFPCVHPKYTEHRHETLILCLFW